MIPRAALLPLLALAAAAAAQEAADKARLDDFALPRVPPAPLQQIAPPRGAVPAATVADRTLAVPALPASAPRPLAQVTAREGATPVTQLAPAGRSAGAAPPLSQPGDSRPGAVVALTGKDHCDPQAARPTAECRRILELRAGEFSATEAPRLSPEQALLVEDQRRERKLSLQRDTPGRMARSADMPDDASTQELASIVIPPPAPPPETAVPDTAQALIEVLKAIESGVVPPTGR